MTDPARRTRALLAYAAAFYAFAGGLALAAASLLPDTVIASERLPLALDAYLATLPTAALVIGWFKGRDQAG